MADEQKTEVVQILADLEINTEEEGALNIPVIEAWNKWDAIPENRREELALQAERSDDPVVPISALTGFGTDGLERAIAAILTRDARVHDIVLPIGDGRRIAWLHAHGEVLSEEEVPDKIEGEEPQIRLTVRIEDRELGRFVAMEGS